MKRLENPQTRPLLLEQIRDVLKNRQNVQLQGDPKDIQLFLNELIQFERGKAIIPPKHEEDYTIQIIQNISFPSSDKIVPEGAQRQLLQEFGWPAMKDLSYVQFFFTKLLKELNHERIIPVVLVENSDMLKQKAFRVLELLSQFTIDRKPIGVPSILCVSRYSPLGYNSFNDCYTIHLDDLVTDEEILAMIETVCPGQSSVFSEEILIWFSGFLTDQDIKARAKQLLAYARKLGLDKVDNDLKEQWKFENNRKRMKDAETVN